MSNNVDFNRTNCDFQLGGAADIHTNCGDQDAFVCKYDANGNYMWGASWGGSNDDASGGAVVDSTGDLCVFAYFTGTVNFNQHGADYHAAAGGADLSLSKFSSHGAYLWVSTFGGSSNEWCYDLTMDRSSGDLYMSGNFSGACDFDPGTGTDIHTGDKHAFLCKFKPQ
jgi:hypothetical protein